MTRMPAADLRAALANFVSRIEAMRDEALEDARTDPSESGERYAKGQWSGFALALDALHIFTGGEFGVGYKKQPSPYGNAAVAAVSAFAAELAVSGQDRKAGTR